MGKSTQVRRHVRKINPQKSTIVTRHTRQLSSLPKTESISDKWVENFAEIQKKKNDSKKKLQEKVDPKKEYQELFDRFTQKRSIKDIVQLISDYRQLHDYSIHNTILLHSQAFFRHDKDFVGVLNSFKNWNGQKIFLCPRCDNKVIVKNEDALSFNCTKCKESFKKEDAGIEDIRILKGSKAFKVYVPIFKKIKVKEPQINEYGEEIEIEKERKVLRAFRLGSVFDISQTTAYEGYIEEQKIIDKKIMKNVEIDYEKAKKILKNNFAELEIKEDFENLKLNGAKGTYKPEEKKITIYEKSGHTAFHELGHHITEVLKITFDGWKTDKSAYAKNEILAELTCYSLMEKLNNHSNYNFNYSNVWSSRITDHFEYKDFERCYKKIKKYVDDLKIGEEKQD